MKPRFFFPLAAMVAMLCSAQPPVVHSSIGTTAEAPQQLKLTLVGKRQQHDWHDKATLDTDIFSPKSVNFHPSGSKFYVNSLEGCATVVYATATLEKLGVIHHQFTSGTGPLWAPPSGYYTFTHYPGGEHRAFGGKPVESTFTHGGRYLWVPYYRRTFDINAQDPSAVAVIDTRTDTIVRMFETGPLPKMIACSHDGNTVAVTHWGDNTVGFIDVSSPQPTQWHHLPPVVVEHKLKLDFSLTKSVNRDSNSGLLLRGTVFTPDDHYLLVACMGGSGIAVIDLETHAYIGMIGGISNARHLIIDHGYLYASTNVAGMVQRVPLDSVLHAIESRSGARITLGASWQMCRVGGGARTIEASPSGRYVFAACNSASALYVVDTRNMQVITSLPIDSYPVGLDISCDGHYLVVTSQAREYHGGNAVNVVRVEYADEAAEAAAVADRHTADSLARHARTDSLAADSLAGSADGALRCGGGVCWSRLLGDNTMLILAALAIIAILFIAYRVARSGKKKK